MCHSNEIHRSWSPRRNLLPQRGHTRQTETSYDVSAECFCMFACVCVLLLEKNSWCEGQSPQARSHTQTDAINNVAPCDTHTRAHTCSRRPLLTHSCMNTFPMCLTSLRPLTILCVCVAGGSSQRVVWHGTSTLRCC